MTTTTRPPTEIEIARISSLQPGQNWGCQGRTDAVKARRLPDGSWAVTAAWIVEESYDSEPGSYMSIFGSLQGRPHSGWTGIAASLGDVIRLYAAARSLRGAALQTPPVGFVRIEKYIAA